jgi:hypothetical protein
MCTHIAHDKHTLGLNKMLGEKVLLSGKERDHALCVVALMEAQAWGLNPRTTVRS